MTGILDFFSSSHSILIATSATLLQIDLLRKVLLSNTQKIGLRLTFLIIIRRKSAKFKVRNVKLPENYVFAILSPIKLISYFFSRKSMVMV